VFNTSHLPLEVARVPDLPDQLPKANYQGATDALVVVRDQEEVPEGTITTSTAALVGA
jgi:hypothetical protein